MFNANIGAKIRDSEKSLVKLGTSDLGHIQMTGQTLDRIYKNGVLVDEIHDHNLVVNSSVNLIMCLLKGQSGYEGIQYWAVGSGATSWDTTLPDPSPTDVRLTSEVGRVAIPASEIKFLDSNGDESTVPTNTIQISHTFNENDCNGTWREFGIFGGNATTDANSGIMLNKRNHAVISKTSDMVIERVIKFTLNLV